MVESFVMEVDLSNLVQGLRPTPGFVGIWDIGRVVADYQTEDRPMTIYEFARGLLHEDAQEAPQWEPVRNPMKIFEDIDTARRAYRFLGMHCGPGQLPWKLDPVFFVKYPHLLPADDPRAVGVRLAPRTCHRIPVPKHVDHRLMAMYRDFASMQLVN